MSAVSLWVSIMYVLLKETHFNIKYVNHSDQANIPRSGEGSQLMTEVAHSS